MRRSEIPTPALLVDVPAMERNIARMAQFFAALPCKLRPHFKAHKTPAIARRQLAAGACTGLTCATVSEAEVAVEVCADLLIANEIIGADKCARVASLARTATVTVAVDSPAGLEQLSAAAAAAGVTIGVLVDVNVGQNRCGVAPGDAALQLARRASGMNNLTLRGVMGYEGHLQPIAERDEREQRARESMQALTATAALLASSGLPCEVVSAGGTGTFDISGRVPGVTEIQAGSYALMDTDYARLGLPFEHACSLLGTVVSRPQADRCVADCGHKTMSKDHGLPGVKGIAGATVTSLNDEHAIISLSADATVRVGDRIELLPSHIDPTVNLHDVFYAVDGDEVVGVWPIEARGYREERQARV